MGTTTVTEYGSLVGFIEDSPGASGLRGYVDRALGDWHEDYDVDALTEAYRKQVAVILARFGLTAAGDRVYGPYPSTLDGDHLREIQNALIIGADFWVLAEDFDR